MRAKTGRIISTAPTIAVAVLFTAVATTQEARSSEDQLAWQRADKYVAPDYEGYFPDDAEGGRRLDEWRERKVATPGSPEEVLELVRRGLRRTKHHRTIILADVGKGYVWNKEQQHPLAIELLYHAAGSPDEVSHYALYHGLTVVSERTDNLVRMLMEKYFATDQEIRGRIPWGFKTYGNPKDAIARLEKLLANDEQLSEEALIATYEVYRQMTGESPAETERLAKAGLWLIGFHERGIETQEGLRAVLERDLSAKTLVDFTSRLDGSNRVGMALVRGISERERLRELLENRPGCTIDFDQLFTSASLYSLRLREFAKHLPEHAVALPVARAPRYEPNRSVYAWNRTDRYVPPDFENFFPDDAAAGAALDQLYAEREHLDLTDRELLDKIRRGLRRSTIRPNLLVSWITSIFQTWPQDPAAVELLYHTLDAPEQTSGNDSLRYCSIYFCFSNLQEKPDNVLRAMAEVYANAARRDDLDGRITWSLKTDREKKFFADRLLEQADEVTKLTESQALAIYDQYRELTGSKPPRPERFEEIGTFVLWGRLEGSLSAASDAEVQQWIADRVPRDRLLDSNVIFVSRKKAEPPLITGPLADGQRAVILAVKGIAGRDAAVEAVMQARNEFTLDMLIGTHQLDDVPNKQQVRKNLSVLLPKAFPNEADGAK